MKWRFSTEGNLWTNPYSSTYNWGQPLEPPMDLVWNSIVTQQFHKPSESHDQVCSILVSPVMVGVWHWVNLAFMDIREKQHQLN